MLWDLHNISLWTSALWEFSSPSYSRTPPPHHPTHVPTHSHTPFSSLCFFFARCLRFKDLGNLCSHLDWGTEMSCSHAVLVNMSRARFFSTCHWTLNVQDVLWLPRLPGDIIIPRLSFLSPAPLASALALTPSPGSLWATLHGIQLILYSLSFILVQEKLPGAWLQRTSTLASTYRLSSGQAAPERVQLSYTLSCFCHLWIHPIIVWFG